MTFTVRSALVGALVLGIVAACGGGTAPSGTGSGSPSAGASTTPAGTSTAPAATSSAPSQGGTDVQDPCGLATVEEVSTALGTDALTATAIPGDATSAYCNYATAGGSVQLAVSVITGPTIDSVYSSYSNSTGAIPVPGVGDAAVVTSQNVLFVRTGDALVGIQPLTEFDTPQDLIAAVTPVAQAIASRL